MLCCALRLLTRLQCHSPPSRVELFVSARIALLSFSRTAYHGPLRTVLSSIGPVHCVSSFVAHCVFSLDSSFVLRRRVLRFLSLCELFLSFRHTLRTTIRCALRLVPSGIAYRAYLAVRTAPFVHLTCVSHYPFSSHCAFVSCSHFTFHCDFVHWTRVSG